MYNTNDIEAGVSIRDCFHGILDNALEEKDTNKKEEYFNILRRCLGVDFSIIYDADGDTLFQIDCHDVTETSYEVLLNEEIEKKKTKLTDEYYINYMHSEIDRIFDKIKYMVVYNVFNGDYYNYLKERKLILEDLIHYFRLFRSMLPISDTLLYGKVTSNSKLASNLKNELNQMVEIITESKTSIVSRKIETLTKTKELLNSRIEEIDAKRLSLRNS